MLCFDLHVLLFCFVWTFVLLIFFLSLLVCFDLFFVVDVFPVLFLFGERETKLKYEVGYRGMEAGSGET